MIRRWLQRRVWTPRVSARAWLPDGCRLHVLPALGAGSVSHALPVPAGACPVSRNPIGGTLEVSYRPASVVAEVVSLHQLLSYATTEHPEGARSMEGLACWIRREVALALGVPVAVRLTLTIMPGPQVYEVRCE